MTSWAGGNYHPSKYDLSLFMSWQYRLGSRDPSITVLTCPVNAQNSASAFDFVCFRPRWDAVNHTWRPPYWHRNIATEFNAIIKISKPYSGFAQGVHWLTPCMTAHGILRIAQRLCQRTAERRPNVHQQRLDLGHDRVHLPHGLVRGCGQGAAETQLRDFFSGVARRKSLGLLFFWRDFFPTFHTEILNYNNNNKQQQARKHASKHASKQGRRKRKRCFALR